MANRNGGIQHGLGWLRIEWTGKSGVKLTVKLRKMDGMRLLKPTKNGEFNLQDMEIDGPMYQNTGLDAFGW